MLHFVLYALIHPMEREWWEIRVKTSGASSDRVRAVAKAIGIAAAHLEKQKQKGRMITSWRLVETRGIDGNGQMTPTVTKVPGVQ